MTTTLYGIKNCDTMKKARTWLNERNIPHVFHNYKKDGADKDVLKQAILEHGHESIINRRGTTWRMLPEHVKDSLNEKTALQIALENTSIIKRPLLVYNGKTYLGFDAKTYEEIFK